MVTKQQTICCCEIPMRLLIREKPLITVPSQSVYLGSPYKCASLKCGAVNVSIELFLQTLPPLLAAAKETFLSLSYVRLLPKKRSRQDSTYEAQLVLAIQCNRGRRQGLGCSRPWPDGITDGQALSIRFTLGGASLSSMP